MGSGSKDGGKPNKHKRRVDEGGGVKTTAAADSQRTGRPSTSGSAAAAIDDIFAKAKRRKQEQKQEEREAKEAKAAEAAAEKRKRGEGSRERGGSASAGKFQAPPPGEYDAARDDIDLEADLGRRRKKTNEGFRIFSEAELRINGGGGTALCPFDCNCCF